MYASPEPGFGRRRTSAFYVAKIAKRMSQLASFLRSSGWTFEST